MTDIHKAATMAVKALERADKISGFPNNKNTLAALREALAAPVVPTGYILVPVEPTFTMCDAGCAVGEIVDHFDIGTAYKAMCAAAPKPKEQTT